MTTSRPGPGISIPAWLKKSDAPHPMSTKSGAAHRVRDKITRITPIIRYRSMTCSPRPDGAERPVLALSEDTATEYSPRQPVKILKDPQSGKLGAP